MMLPLRQYTSDKDKHKHFTTHRPFKKQGKDDKSHHKECIVSSDLVPIGTFSTETIGANILTHPSVVNPLLSVHDHVTILYCKGCWVAECTDGHRQRAH